MQSNTTYVSDDLSQSTDRPARPEPPARPARPTKRLIVILVSLAVAGVLWWLYAANSKPSTPAANIAPAIASTGVTFGELVRLTANADGTLTDVDGDTFYCGKTAPATEASMKACRWVSSPKPVVVPSALPEFTVTGHIGNYRITLTDGRKKDCLSIPKTPAHLSGCYEVAK